MHLLLAFVFFGIRHFARFGVVGGSRSDAFRCPDDYCYNEGKCFYVTEYLSSVSSLTCPSGWIANEGLCYRVVWNQSESHNAARETCREIDAQLSPKLVNANLSSLAQKLTAAMNFLHMSTKFTVDLWTEHCERTNGQEACLKVRSPHYNTTYLDDKRSRALPLCATNSSTEPSTGKQCRCKKNLGNDRCQTTVTNFDSDDHVVCKRLSCSKDRALYVEFSAFGRLEDNKSACGQTGTTVGNSSISPRQCYSTNSLTAVKFWCQGKRFCDLSSKLNNLSVTSVFDSCNSSVDPYLMARTSCRKNVSECPPMDKDSIAVLSSETCWHFVRRELTWWAGLDFCNRRGGSLAFVPNNATNFVPGHVLEKLASTPFNVWIAGERNKSSTSGQEQGCFYLHVEPDTRSVSQRKVSVHEKLKCDLAGTSYPWVCSIPLQNDSSSCPENTTLFSEKSCNKMMHEPKSWGEAKADCLNQKGDLISFSNQTEFKSKLADYLIENMKKRIWEFWIAGTATDGRDPDRDPVPCSIGKVSYTDDLNEVSATVENCNLSVTKSIVLCALPPEDSTHRSTTTEHSITSTLVPTTKTVKSTASATSDTSDPIDHTSSITGSSPCPPTQFVDNRGTTYWPPTEAGTTARAPCPGKNSKGMAKWFCDATTSKFSPESGPDVSECSALGDLNSLVNESQVVAEDKVNVILERVEQTPLFGSDLDRVLDATDRIRFQHQQSTWSSSVDPSDKYRIAINFTETVTDIVNKLLAPENENAWLDRARANRSTATSTRLLQSVDAAGFSLATVMLNSSVSIRKDAVDMVVANLSTVSDHSVESVLAETLGTFVSVPHEIYSMVNGSVMAVFTNYKNLSVVLKNVKHEKWSYRLNSRVIGLSINSETSTYKFREGFVFFTAEHVQSVFKNNVSCVFWNTSLDFWDDTGCLVNATNETHTTCQCDHLTNFAVLMDVHGAIKEDSAHAVILTWITILGCSLSIFCLSVTLIIFVSFRSLWSLRSTIHCNLCVSLIVAQCVLLAGLDRTEIKLVCGIVAGVLHFSWLSAFAWVALEGIHIYVLLVKVFDTAEQKVWTYYAAGYGLPAIVVAISAAVKPSGYGTERYCWLSVKDGLIFSFVGPMLVVVLFNFVIFGLAMRAAASVKSQRHDSMVGKTKLWIRRSASLIPLLGLSWIFGFMYADDSSVIFAYFFAIFNSAQGLFIFIFHCIRNEKVQQVVTRFIIQQREKSTSKLFTKQSRSNSCTVTSSVRTTTSSDEMFLNRTGRRSLVPKEERVKSRVIGSRWRSKLIISTNRVSPERRGDSETAQLQGISFRLLSDISL